MDYYTTKSNSTVLELPEGKKPSAGALYKGESINVKITSSEAEAIKAKSPTVAEQQITGQPWPKG